MLSCDASPPSGLLRSDPWSGPTTALNRCLRNSSRTFATAKGGHLGRRAAFSTRSERTRSRDLEVYVPITKHIEPRGRISSKRLPPGRAATLIDRGGYETLAGARSLLLSWVERTALRPAGPLRIVYLQFGAAPELEIPRGFVTDDVADFVTELQQPIDEGPLTSPR